MQTERKLAEVKSMLSNMKSAKNSKHLDTLQTIGKDSVMTCKSKGLNKSSALEMYFAHEE